MTRKLSEGGSCSSGEVLIVKLGAAGDVGRTTPLLRRVGGDVTWVTTSKNYFHFVAIAVFSYGLTTLTDIEADPICPSASVAVAVIT